MLAFQKIGKASIPVNEIPLPILILSESKYYCAELEKIAQRKIPMKKAQLFILIAALGILSPGYAQKNYQWAFKTDFDKVYDFYDGHAIVMTGIKKGFIDKTGATSVNPKYNIIDAYSEGLASAGFINFSSMESKSGFIDETGVMVINPEYEVTSPFKEGLACVKTTDQKWGYLNKKGEMVIPAKFDGAYSFHDGAASIKVGEKWGIINRYGNTIIPPKFDDALGFFEGWCCVKKEGKWGFVDGKGSVVIPLKFDFASSFKDGLARVEMNGKFGFIDKKGSYFIDPTYDMLYNFFDGLARFKQGEKWGFINKKKQIAIPADLEFAGDFSENLARFKENGLWGFIDTEGRRVIEPEFNMAYDFREGLARVEKDGKWGFILYSPSGSKEIISDIPEAAPEELTERKIKSGQKIKIGKPDLILGIYDHKKIDGDIISLNYNGKWILRNFILKGEKFEIPLHIEKASTKGHYILLYANNLGKEPPNTVAMEIFDGEKTQEVILNSDLNQCDIIYFEQ